MLKSNWIFQNTLIKYKTQKIQKSAADWLIWVVFCCLRDMYLNSCCRMMKSETCSRTKPRRKHVHANSCYCNIPRSKKLRGVWLDSFQTWYDWPSLCPVMVHWSFKQAPTVPRSLVAMPWTKWKPSRRRARNPSTWVAWSKPELSWPGVLICLQNVPMFWNMGHTAKYGFLYIISPSCHLSPVIWVEAMGQWLASVPSSWPS